MSETSLDQIFSIAPNCVYKSQDNIVYILNHSTATIHTLNESASAIWLELIKHPRTTNELVNIQKKKYEADQKTLQKDTKELLNHLLKNGFIISTKKRKKKKQSPL